MRLSVNSATLATSPNWEPAPSPSFWKQAISFPVLLAVLLAGGMFVPLRTFWVDPDVWWHIKVGATILSTHHWPTADAYSYTAYGTHWIAYEWLGDVVMAIFANLWGLRGLMVLDVILAAAILFALYTLVTLRCKNPKAAFMVCTCFLPLVYSSLNLRPQMISYLLLILTLLILERFRQGHMGALWLLPPLFLVWVNTHGIFILGLFALGVYWASGLVKIDWGNLESRRWTTRERVRLELVGLLSLLILTVTPYGPEVLLYPFDVAFFQSTMMGNIVEWQPMMFDKAFGRIFLVLVLAFLLAQVTLRPCWRLAELALLFTGIAGACIHMRMVLVFVPFSAPLYGVILARWIPRYEPAKDKHALNAILMTLVVAAVIGYFPSRADLESIVEQKWPVRAVAYLRQHPAPQPMLNSYGYGGYLIWQMSDIHKVFIDGRADIYMHTGVFVDYLHIARLGFPAPFLLNAYNVQSCLLDRTEILATLLNASPEWQKAYGDPVSVLYIRRPRPAESVKSEANTSAGTLNRRGSSRASSR